ncbi:MAG: threonylcarbamoyl-AMP synthase [Bacteroidetes bacterium]|nr:threonylcarbamoyl-AMP synthase [Bacteroidota bacterium]
MEEQIVKTLEYLSKGKTILYPTDTIWGIGCDATNSRAVEKIYRIKRRVEKKSLIILLDSAVNLKNFVDIVPGIAYDLIENIETPLTIIFPVAKNLPKNVIASDKTIAIRVIRDEFCRELIRRFGKPIVSTSANISGEPNPILFNRISQEILDKVDYVVDLHRDRVSLNRPSRIIKLEIDGEFKVIRE